MRVLVASDGMGALTSAQAGAALASGWAGADVRVLPVGDSGHGFLTAYADLMGAEVEIAVEDGYAVTSARADGDVVLQVSAPEGGDGLPLDGILATARVGPGPGAGRAATGPGAARSQRAAGARRGRGDARRTGRTGGPAARSGRPAAGHGDRGRSRGGARGPRRHRTDRRRARRSDSASTCSACAGSPRSAAARRALTRPTCWPPTPRWTGSPDSPRPTRRRPPAPARAVVSGSPCWPWAAG